MLRQILVEFGVAPVEKWAHLEDAIAAAGDDIERVAKRGLSLAKIGKPQITAVLAHGTLKRLQLDLLGKRIMLWIVDPGYAAHHHVSMRGALARYVQRYLQIELRDQLLGVAIGGRCVVTRIAPDHCHRRHRIGAGVQDGGLVGTKIGCHYRSLAVSERPVDNLSRGFIA